MAHSTIDTVELGDELNRYGPTVARDVSTRRIRLPTRTIDAHSHIFVPEAAKYVAPYFQLAKDGFFSQMPEETTATNSKQNRDRAVALVDTNDRVAILDTQGIDIQVVASQPAQTYYDIAPEHCRKAAQMVNDGVASFVSARPDRFAGFASVPLIDPPAAVEELRRAITQLKLRGVQILTNVRGKEITDAAFEPFWAAAAELGAVVMIHPYGSTNMNRLSQYYLLNTLGNPLDTTIAMHHVILSGLLDRFPELKLFFVHGGGFLPAYSGRLDHSWGARRDSRGAIEKPPSTYLRKLYIDSLVFTPHQLEYLVHTFGADHVLMGTDFPFDVAEYYPIEHIMSVASFSPEQQSLVAGGAAARLLQLD